MSLTAREQHALHVLEDRLASADPGLASRLATFTRMTSGEEMPSREKIQRGWRRAPGRLRRRRQGPRRDAAFQRARRVCRRLGSQRAMLLLCLTVAVAEGIAVALAGGLNGTNAPPAAPRPCPAAPGRLPPEARDCTVTGAAGGTLGVRLTMRS